MKSLKVGFYCVFLLLFSSCKVRQEKPSETKFIPIIDDLRASLTVEKLQASVGSLSQQIRNKLPLDRLDEVRDQISADAIRGKICQLKSIAADLPVAANIEPEQVHDFVGFYKYIYVFMGGGASAQALAMPFGYGVDFVWDLWNQQFGTFYYRTRGFTTGLIGFEANVHGGFAFGETSGVLQAWSGYFKATNFSFSLPLVPASASVEKFVGDPGITEEDSMEERQRKLADFPPMGLVGVNFGLSAGLDVSLGTLTGLNYSDTTSFYTPFASLNGRLAGIYGGNFLTPRRSGTNIQYFEIAPLQVPLLDRELDSHFMKSVNLALHMLTLNPANSGLAGLAIAVGFAKKLEAEGTLGEYLQAISCG